MILHGNGFSHFNSFASVVASITRDSKRHTDNTKQLIAALAYNGTKNSNNNTQYFPSENNFNSSLTKSDSLKSRKSKIMTKFRNIVKKHMRTKSHNNI